MSYRGIILERRDRIALLTVNRPDVLNALDPPTWEELADAVRHVEQDPDIRVLIVTGAGEKAFAAGSDIRSLRERTMWDVLQYSSQDVLTELENLPKPVIAAVNGYALGGGCELAMACDIRIAAETARIGLPEVNLGIVPGAGGTQRLVRLVGLGKAKELIFTGDIIDAHEAERIGLVNKVVPQDELLDAAFRMAEKILAKGPLAVSMAKRIVQLAVDVDLRSGLAMEKLAQSILFATEDRREGMDAFLEKRKARFQGR